MSSRCPLGTTRRDLLPDLPRTAVALTASGDGPELRRTLSVLRDRTAAVGAELLLVLDRWSDDPGASAHDALEAMVDLVVLEPGGDRGAAVNAAARATSAEVLVLTRIGADPSQAWLRELVAPFRRAPHLTCVGGPVEPVFTGGVVPRWYRRLGAHRLELDPSPVHRLPEGAREYVASESFAPGPLPSAANVAWRRDWLLESPFERNLAPMDSPAADIHAALRAREGGHRIAHAPNAVMHLEVPVAKITEEAVERELRARATGMAAALRGLGQAAPAAGESAWAGPWLRLAPRSVRIGRRLARVHAEASQAASVS